MVEAVTRVGGHITLLFSVNTESSNPDAQGSRGAGICLKQGVDAIANMSPRQDDQASISVTVIDYDGDNAPENCSEIYLRLIEELEIDNRFTTKGKNIELSVKLGLPRSQGLGMSAAGLLAAANALIEASRLVDDDLANLVAHRTERRLSSGLGDVLALSAGGIELRLEPGSPVNYGKAVGFETELSMILVWSHTEERHTRDYIDDDSWKRAISVAGESAVNRLRVGAWNATRWDDLLLESETFAIKSGLIDEPARNKLLKNVESVLKSTELSDDYVPRLCMLGTSAVILPRHLDRGNIEKELQIISSELGKCGLEHLFIQA